MNDYSNSKSIVNNEQCVMDYQHNKSVILHNEIIDPNLLDHSNLWNKNKIFDIKNTKVCNNDISKVIDEKIRYEVVHVLNLKDENEIHHLVGNKFVKLKDKTSSTNF